MVTSVEVIEHVNNPQEFVATCLQLVKPGGLLILSTLNRTNLSYATAIYTAEQILKWVPPGTHDWSKFLSPQELEKLVWNASQVQLPTQDNALRTQVDKHSTITAGMIYKPYPIESWELSGSNFDVNYIMAFTAST